LATKESESSHVGEGLDRTAHNGCIAKTQIATPCSLFRRVGLEIENKDDTYSVVFLSHTHNPLFFCYHIAIYCSCNTMAVRAVGVGAGVGVVGWVFWSVFGQCHVTSGVAGHIYQSISKAMVFIEVHWLLINCSCR
jgi:hypothetical protein